MQIKQERNGKVTIRLDKMPEFLYVNENSTGCGQVYLEGERIKGVQRVKIESETNRLEITNELKYSVQHITLGIQGDGEMIPKISITGNMNETVKEII